MRDIAHPELTTGGSASGSKTRAKSGPAIAVRSTRNLPANVWMATLFSSRVRTSWRCRSIDDSKIAVHNASASVSAPVSNESIGLPSAAHRANRPSLPRVMNACPSRLIAKFWIVVHPIHTCGVVRLEGKQMRAIKSPSLDLVEAPGPRTSASRRG